MGIITDIKTGINTRLGVSIPSYTKLAYEINIEDNKFKGNSKGFSIVPSPANEVEGLLNAFTLDHSFEVSLTNSYNRGAKSQIGDALKTSRISEIMDDILLVYKDIIKNKILLNPNVLIINGLSINAPEFLEHEKVIIIRFSMNIKYKNNI